MSVEQLITRHLDLWTSSVKVKKTQGRGSSKKQELYGVKRLRELILELAVCGKLVPQDPNDEPASILIEKIKVEKNRLIQNKDIKKPKPIKTLTDIEILYELPGGWSWTRLGDITEIAPRNSLEDNVEVSFVPMPMISTSYKGDHDCEVRIWGDIKKGYTHFADGDIGLAKITPCFENSKAAVFKHLKNKVGAGTTELHIARPIADTIDPLFILLYLKAPMFLKKGKPKMTGSAGQKRIPYDYFAGNPLPLAPINEQRRIVAKVDELMTLCDQLEQQTEDSLDAHKLLVDTLLATLTNARDANELSDNWARLAEHFDTLITTEYAVEQLKQTILQLAVQGKLVPQDPNDEPASELLKRIAAEKEQLIKDKKIKKQKPLPEITSEEISFKIPMGWTWVKFGTLSEFINGDRGKNYPNKSEYVESGVPWINTGHIEKDGTLSVGTMNYITTEKFDSLRGGKITPNDLVYCLRGATFGKTAFVKPYTSGAIASSLMIIRPYNSLLSEYIYKYLISPFGRSQVFRFDNGSAQPNLSANSVNLYAFPCPPLAEQQRIVTKIDELMIVCDQLNEKLKVAQITQNSLSNTIVNGALG